MFFYTLQIIAWHDNFIMVNLFLFGYKKILLEIYVTSNLPFWYWNQNIHW